jgi:hypothetical protein
LLGKEQIQEFQVRILLVKEKEKEFQVRILLGMEQIQKFQVAGIGGKGKDIGISERILLEFILDMISMVTC